VAHTAAFTLGGRVYVVGGRDASDSALTRASEIDPSTWRVEAEPPLGQPIADAAVAAGRRTLLIGGWNTSTSSAVLQASTRPANGQDGPDHPRGRAPVQPLFHSRRHEGDRRRGVLRPAGLHGSAYVEAHQAAHPAVQWTGPPGLLGGRLVPTDQLRVRWNGRE